MTSGLISAGTATNLKVFSHPLHAHGLLHALNESRKNVLLCDGVVQINEIQIPVQKNVLSAASSYFRALYSYEVPKQSNNCGPHCIKLDTMTADTFQQILDFIYTSEIRLCEETIQDILQAADVLLLSSLKDLCCEYLEGLISTHNCIGIQQFAEQFTCPHVYHTATKYLDQHFREISFCEEFLQQSREALSKLLQRDSLCVASEDVICDSVLRWGQHDVTRISSLPLILQTSVRLAYIGDQYIEESLRHDGSLGSAGLRSLVLTARKESVVGKQRGQATIIVGCGGEGQDEQDLGVMEAMRQTQCVVPHDGPTARSQPWIQLAPMSSPRVSHCVVQAGDFLFAIGGRDSNGQITNSGEKYEPLTNQWTPIPPMERARVGFGLVAIDDKIYALGGSNDMSDPVTSVEEYNIYTNRWRNLPDMNLKRAWSAYTVANKKIYVLGGGVMGKLYEAVECFDPKSETWTSVAPMKERRFDARAVGMEDQIYVFGGLRRLACPSAAHGNGSGMKFCGTEMYNTEEKHWSTMAEQSQGMCTMTETSRIDGAVVIGDEIYIVGQLDIGGFHQYIRAFNVLTCRWRGITSNLPQGVRNMPVATLTLPNAVLYKHLWSQNKLRFSDLTEIKT